MTATAAPPPPAVEDRFAVVTAGVRALLWTWHSLFSHALGNALSRNVNRKTARFAALARQFRDGTLAAEAPLPARTRRAASAKADTPAADAPAPDANAAAATAAAQNAAEQRVRLPSRFNWFRRRVAEVVPQPRYQWLQFPAVGELSGLLQRPDLQALHAAAPRRVGRLLRPLCVMLGVPMPDWLKLPRRKRASRARPRAPKPDPVKLPPEVAAFARYERQRQRRAAQRGYAPPPDAAAPHSSLRAAGEAIQGQRSGAEPNLASPSPPVREACRDIRGPLPAVTTPTPLSEIPPQFRKRPFHERFNPTDVVLHGPGWVLLRLPRPRI